MMLFTHFLKNAPKDKLSEEFHKALLAPNADLSYLKSLLDQGADIHWAPVMTYLDAFTFICYHPTLPENEKKIKLEFLKDNHYDIYKKREPGNALTYGLARKTMPLEKLDYLLTTIQMDPYRLNYYGIDSFSVALNCGRTDCFERMLDFVNLEEFKPKLANYREILKSAPIEDTAKAHSLAFLQALEEKWNFDEKITFSPIEQSKKQQKI